MNRDKRFELSKMIQEDEMAGNEWEKFGDEIRKTVQDAIENQDFHRLNQNITDTIDRAMGAAFHNVSERMKQARGIYRGPVWRSRRRLSIWRAGRNERAVCAESRQPVWCAEPRGPVWKNCRGVPIWPAEQWECRNCAAAGPTCRLQAGRFG